MRSKKMKKALIFLLLIVMFLNAFAKKDSTKMKYVHSYISINVEYGRNIAPQPGWQFGGGLGGNISGYVALKESYFGIALMAGYSRSLFVGSSYHSTMGNIQNYYNGESSGSYNEIYALAGLGLKIPEHTTRYAIEVRVMIGAATCTEPATKFFTSSISPLRSDSGTYQGSPYSAFSHTVLDGGIGFGYKISKHWGIMGYFDFMAAHYYQAPELEINTIKFSTGLVYTFGKMIGDFVY